MENPRMNDIIEIDFDEPIDRQSFSQYGKRYKEIKWRRNKNKEVIGISFKRGDGEKPKIRDKIHNILWYFGQFEDNETDTEL
jgi:hypothetical protein